jgi:archaemetzincin
MATIAIVTCDLWPGDLNWVFGQASMKDRVGVWSLYRNGDPRVNEESFRLCLRRTLKTAAHETGHMLGIPHCARWECCMNGSRSREENDRQSLEFCPECQPKIWWSCGADPAKRCQALVEFCEREGLSDEADLFKAEAEALAK